MLPQKTVAGPVNDQSSVWKNDIGSTSGRRFDSGRVHQFCLERGIRDMKIKGVYKDKKRYGDPIEFTPEEKFPIAVGMALSKSAGENKVRWPETIEMKDKTWQKRDATGKFASNVYNGSGTVTFREHDNVKDKLYAVKKAQFKIEFQDSSDELGLPDIKINSFELK